MCAYNLVPNFFGLLIKYDCFEVHKPFAYLQEGRLITWVCIPTSDNQILQKNWVVLMW